MLVFSSPNFKGFFDTQIIQILGCPKTFSNAKKDSLKTKNANNSHRYIHPLKLILGIFAHPPEKD
jgi:hypothetical protein